MKKLWLVLCMLVLAVSTPSMAQTYSGDFEVQEAAVRGGVSFVDLDEPGLFGGLYGRARTPACGDGWLVFKGFVEGFGTPDEDFSFQRASQKPLFISGEFSIGLQLPRAPWLKPTFEVSSYGESLGDKVFYEGGLEVHLDLDEFGRSYVYGGAYAGSAFKLGCGAVLQKGLRFEGQFRFVSFETSGGARGYYPQTASVDSRTEGAWLKLTVESHNLGCERCDIRLGAGILLVDHFDGTEWYSGVSGFAPLLDFDDVDSALLGWIRFGI